MPRYYTPNSRIRFANSGSAAFKKLTQTVEQTVQKPSEHGETLDVLVVPSHFNRDDFSGVIRYQNDPRSGSAVYSVSGAFMDRPSTQNSSSEPVSSSSGSVISMVPATGAAHSVEVNELNAYFSGAETIETITSGTASFPASTRDLFYSKSRRMQYLLGRRVPDIGDVYANIPPGAPSGSSGSAPFVAGSTTQRAVSYKAQFGTVAATGAGFITITDWPTYLNNTTLSVQTSRSLMLALAGIGTGSGGNIIYMGSVTGTVTSSEFSGASLKIYLSQSSSNPSVSSNVLIHSWQPLSDPIMGTYFNSTPYTPVSIGVPIGSPGKIRDIRAWVEFLHDYRIPTTPGGQTQGLQNVQVSLRSPNTSFRAAHPLWNEPKNLDYPIRTDQTLTGTSNQFSSTFYDVPELLKNSYLLWDGHNTDVGLLDTLASTSLGISSYYHEFDTDIDMRTVFWDGASVNNPRDIQPLFSGGAVRPYGDLVVPAQSGGLYYYYQSPTSGAIFDSTVWSGSVAPAQFGTGSLTCSGFPWMLDDRYLPGTGTTGTLIVPGAFSGTNYYQDVFSIPKGWLSGKDVTVGPWSKWMYGPQTNIILDPVGFVRPTTRKIYVCGGAFFDGAATTHSLNILTASYGIVNGSASVLPGGLITSVLPTTCTFGPGMAYWSGSYGERVIIVGGSSASNADPTNLSGTSNVWVGSFDVTGNISWTACPAMPSGVLKPVVVIDDLFNKAYVFAGLTSGSSGQTLNELLTGLIDPNTGLITSWSTSGQGSLGFTNAGNTAFGSITRQLNTPTFVNVIVGDPTVQAHYQASIDATGTFQLPFTLITTSSFIAPAVNTASQSTNAYPKFFSSDAVYGPGWGSWTGYPKTWSNSLEYNPSSGTMRFGTPKIGVDTGDFEPDRAGGVDGNLLVVAGVVNLEGSYDLWIGASLVGIPAPASGEFGTYGRQVGPPKIRPVYPLLDDIYALKASDRASYNGSFNLSQPRANIVGYRPGLRSTEVSGNWKFLFGTTPSAFDPSSAAGYVPPTSSGIWVRQVRVEAIVDVSGASYEMTPSKERRFTKPNVVPGADGLRTISIVSGATAWDIGTNFNQVLQSPDYGRTVSITTNTSSSPDSYAVLTFITGNLYTRLSHSGIFDPSWYLGGNGFGTPYIPDSSMSLGTGTAEQVDAAAAQQIFDEAIAIQTLVPNANDMVAFLNRQGYTKTALQRWEETIAMQASSSAAYFPPL